MSQGWFPEDNQAKVGTKGGDEAERLDDGNVGSPVVDAPRDVVFSDAEMSSLSNKMVAAAATLDSKEFELAELGNTLELEEVWLASSAVLNHPFVQRHIREYELSTPDDYLALQREVEALRNARDSLEMKYQQERISCEMKLQLSQELLSATEQYEQGFRAVRNRLSSAELQLSRSKDGVDSL